MFSKMKGEARCFQCSVHTSSCQSLAVTPGNHAKEALIPSIVSLSPARQRKSVERNAGKLRLCSGNKA